MKVLLVTGGNRGIGASVCRAAARSGWSIGVNYPSDDQYPEEVLRDLKLLGASAAPFKADIALLGEVVEMFEGVTRNLGQLSGLVNNAGVDGGLSRLDDLSTEVLVRTVGVNLIGTIYCAREAVRRMSTRHGGLGGAIVNISSMAAVLGAGGDRIHYAATKGGIEAMTIGLAREVAAEGIRVNAVRPGLIDTAMNHPAEDPDRLARLAATVPMGRHGEPEEVAEAVEWLLSDAASYVTGAVLTVSGGR